MFRALLVSLLAVVPSSANYILKSYDVGSGANTGTSANYILSGEAGSSGGSLTSASYKLPVGIKASTTAAVPPAPTLTDVNSAYNTLHLTLNVSSFPSDTKYLIAISNNGFTTTNYIQLDDTIGSTATASNYQTYAAWGGSSGFNILGLANGTSYSAKVAALQGNGTGSAFGPMATAATQTPSATFSLQTSLASNPPFSVGFSSLPASQVTAGGATVTATVTTNATYGGDMLINDQSAGLTSTLKSFTIASANADLGSAASGYGAQVTNTSQVSGGPITSLSPYNGTSNVVGALTVARQPFASWSSPITNGAATFQLLAKSSSITPAASDYADVMTISLLLMF